MKTIGVTTRLARNTAPLLGLVFLVALGLHVGVGAVFAQAAPADAMQRDSDVNQLLNTLNVWVNILAILVTGVIGIAAFYLIAQYRQAARYAEELKRDLITRMEREIATLKEVHELARLRPPDAILAEARRDYEPRIGTVQKSLESTAAVLQERISGLSTALERLGHREGILKDVDKRFKRPRDLEEILLRKVLNAFLEIRTLTDEDRKGVARQLSTDAAASVDEQDPSKTGA